MIDQEQWGRAKYYLYRDLFEWWGPSVVAMQCRDKTLPPWRDNCPAMIELRRRANAEWESLTGLPPLGDPGRWYSAGVAAGYSLPEVAKMPADQLRAIVIAWARAKKANAPVAVDDTDWRIVTTNEAAEHFMKTPKCIRDWVSGRTPSPYRIERVRQGWVRIHPDDWKI